MNKLHFRNRTLDVNKPMPIFRSEDMPELSETLVSATRRSVPQLSSGMEKEEESEHHLQRALSAQQCYGSAQELAIPIPEISQDSSEYEELYKSDFKQQRQLIHIQAFGFDQEKPDYDMDSEDEDWLNRQAKRMDIKPLQFEEMMDRLEKGSGQQVVQISEAKALLKEDDDLTIAVYDYWLNKKLRLQNSLIPTVRTEKRDGSTSVNPYVAFRRRSEKMQTRKNRKNDEVSYEKMLKLQRDLKKALTLLDFIRRREKMKREMLRLTVEVCEKRHEIRDVDGRLLMEAEAQKRSKPLMSVSHYQRAEEKRRNKENRKRKHRGSVSEQEHLLDSRGADLRVWEAEMRKARVTEPEQQEEEDPDGSYAFYRKEGCVYLAPGDGGLEYEPSAPKQRAWTSAASRRPRHARWLLCQLRHPRRCVGYARRRVGRGGRVLLDRCSTLHDPVLTDVDLDSTDTADPVNSAFIEHVRAAGIPYFTPTSSPEEASTAAAGRPLVASSYPASSLHQRLATPASVAPGISRRAGAHGVSLLQQHARLQQQQQGRRLSLLGRSREDVSRTEGRSDVPRLAAVTSVPAGSNGGAALTTKCNGSLPSSVNGPLPADGKSLGLSTSPAASVYQLNFPLPGSSLSTDGLCAPPAPASKLLAALPRPQLVSQRKSLLQEHSNLTVISKHVT